VKQRGRARVGHASRVLAIAFSQSRTFLYTLPAVAFEPDEKSVSARHVRYPIHAIVTSS